MKKKSIPDDREYQEEAVTKTIIALKEDARCQLHMAPGSGKTIVSLLIKERLRPKITVVFVPSIQLIYQQYLAWSKYRSQKFTALVVTSGRMSESDKEELRILKQVHVGTTTEKINISSFLTESSSLPKVVFCTYRSAKLFVRAAKETSIDLAVFDEAHHVAGNFEKNAVILLDNDKINIHNRLFMTATPRLNKDVEQSLVCAGMDDINLFGRVAYTLSFREAVKRNILSDYQLIAASVTKDDLDEVRVRTSRKEKIALAAIKKMFDEHGVCRGLTYHSKVARATKFSKDLSKVLGDGVYVDTLHGVHKAEHRTRVLNKLRTSDQAIITNVRVLGEGFDLDALDFVVIVDPKSSRVDIVQNIGRVMRKHPEKEIGTVIVPICVESKEEKINSAAASSKYLPIWKIADALGNLDLTLGSQIRDARAIDREPKGKELLFFSRHIKVAGLSENEAELLAQMKENVRLHVLYGTKAWLYSNQDERVKELTTFCEKNNRLPRRDSDDPEENALAMFYCRVFQKKDISPRLRKYLEVIGSRWGQNAKDIAYWRKAIDDVLEFCEENGRLPSQYSDDRRLGLIASKLRNFTFPNSVRDIYEEEVRQLLARYPSVKDIEMKRMEDRTKEIEEFCKKHGRLVKQEDNLEWYQFIGRRNHGVKKSRPDLSARLNKLVATYGKADMNLYNTRTSDTKKQIELYKSRNRDNLNRLREFIIENGFIPTPKTNKALYTFAARRYSKTANPIFVRLVNDVINEAKADKALVIMEGMWEELQSGKIKRKDVIERFTNAAGLTKEDALAHYDNIKKKLKKAA